MIYLSQNIQDFLVRLLISSLTALWLERIRSFSPLFQSFEIYWDVISVLVNDQSLKCSICSWKKLYSAAFYCSVLHMYLEFVNHTGQIYIHIDIFLVFFLLATERSIYKSPIIILTVFISPSSTINLYNIYLRLLLGSYNLKVL